jgi:hypothetical protein
MKFRKKQADMGSRLQKALVMEQKAQQILLELKDEIICDVKAAGPIPGVEIPDSSVTCAIVNLSALHRHSLNPSTYIPAVQADAVKRKLAPKQTVHGVLESLDEMIESQSVRFSDKEQVLLNSNTIAALVPWKCSLPGQRA